MQKFLGIGIDICKIDRIARILKKPYSKRFLTRVLQKNEFYSEITPEFVAGRWAAKEALVKSTGHKTLVYSDVQVTYNALGQPEFKFYSEYLNDLFSKNSFLLSISHESDYAAAVVLSILK